MGRRHSRPCTLHSTDCAGYKGLKYIWSNGPTDHKPELAQSGGLLRETQPNTKRDNKQKTTTTSARMEGHD